jgi:hypothetical protein
MFVSVTRDIALGKHDWLYLYLDGGKNAPWYGSSSSLHDGVLRSNFRGGEYWAGGVGYLWGLGGHTSKAVLISAGYAVKKLGNDELIAAPCVSPGCNISRYDYINRMYQFMIGFRF